MSSTTSTSTGTTGLEPGCLTLRQAADALSTSTTTLRKMIRQGRLPEADKVRTLEGRVWSIPASSIPGIAERAGFQVSVTDSIDLRDPEAVEADAAADDTDVVPGRAVTDVADLDSWRHDPVPSETVEVNEDPAVVTPIGLVDAPAPPPEEEVPAEQVVAEAPAVQTTVVEPDVAEPAPVAEATASTAVEAIGSAAELAETEPPSGAPSLAEVLDTALLEKLLGAKDAEGQALVKAERQRTEYEALAARQLEVERWYSDADLERKELAERLHNEALARAIADARVTELRDQLQREITYAEAERYERRQALARETKMASESAEVRSALGWLGRRRLRRQTPES